MRLLLILTVQPFSTNMCSTFFSLLLDLVPALLRLIGDLDDGVHLALPRWLLLHCCLPRDDLLDADLDLRVTGRTSS